MKGTGDTFSFNYKDKRAEEVILSGKRTVAGQDSGELYTKKHRWGNSY